MFFFKLFTLDSSWMQAIDYDCKGARERIQPGICFSGGLHAGTWCHHQIRGRNGADASVRDGGGDASEHLRLKQKKRMLMQGLSQQGESHQSSWSQTQSSVPILPSMKHAQIIDFYIFWLCVYYTPFFDYTHVGYIQNIRLCADSSWILYTSTTYFMQITLRKLQFAKFIILLLLILTQKTISYRYFLSVWYRRFF